MRDDEGVIQLWSISPNGGEIRQVTRNPFDIASSFTWSPDGTSIAYAADNSVFITDVDSRTSVRLTPRCDDSCSPRPEACVYSPDGKLIAYVRHVAHSDGRKYNQIFIVPTES